MLSLMSVAAAQWEPQESHTTESLRGTSVFNESIAWASGTRGTFLTTFDGGKTWNVGHVPGAENLDFRDVESFGRSVYLLAAGPGEQSRIYKTNDRGEHWELQFTNHEPKGFLDCMAFWDENHGIVVGDPVNGRFQVLLTSDGGKHWDYADPKKMPPAMEDEGAFAASGTCVTTQGGWNHGKNAWFATGGSAARVFRTTNGGKSWKVSDTPIVHGPASAGIFSVAFSDEKHGVIAGGDYQKPEEGGANLAATEDGGKTWKLVPIAPQKYFSGVAYVSQTGWLALVGTSVSAKSVDGLKSWNFFLPAGFNAIAANPGLGVAWAAGAKGTIARGQLGFCGSPCESAQPQRRER